MTIFFWVAKRFRRNDADPHDRATLEEYTVGFPQMGVVLVFLKLT